MSASLAGLVLVTLGGGPASAGPGIDGVHVPLDAPTSHSQDIRWVSTDPASHALPSGAPSLRYTFPSNVTTTDVDPATLPVAAVCGAGPRGSTTAGLRMDGWDLLVDPAALLASPLGSCGGSDPWFLIVLRGAGSFDTLDLTVELYLAPSSTSEEVHIDLGNQFPTDDHHTYTTAPAHVVPGSVVDLSAEPHFFDSYGGYMHVEIIDAAGVVLVQLGTTDWAVSNDSSRLTITLPLDLPSTAVGVQVRCSAFTEPSKDVTVPFTSPVPDAVEAYVSSVYEDLFNRDPDPEGLSNWTTALRRGAAYGTVADAITYSDENRTQLIKAAYQKYLDRAPDAGGLQYWLGLMRTSLHIEDMQAGFVSSPEYYSLGGGNDRGWIARLYQRVLDRTPTDDELNFWQRQLNMGRSRYSVALGFLYSAEHLTTVVDGYYAKLLHRQIDPSGQHYWVQLIQSGYRDEQIIAGIVSSAEYRANIPGT